MPKLVSHTRLGARRGTNRQPAVLRQVTAEAIHDLTNPLSAIIGLGEALLARGLDRAACAEVRKIGREARRATRIVGRTLGEIARGRTSGAGPAVKGVEEGVRRLATVVRDSNDAITVQDLEGRITAWNRGAELMYSWSEAEALRMHMRNIVPEAQRDASSALAERLAGGETLGSFETQRITKHGRILHVWLTATALRDEAGRVTAIATTERDITERKQAEEDIRRLTEQLEERVRRRTAELEAANKELESFTYSVSHDLRAPLRSISGFSRALLEDCADKLGAEGKANLERILAATGEMGQLIHDLLNLSHVSRSEIRRDRVDLGALARASAPALQETEPERQVTFVIAEDVVANGDRRLLRVVMANLFGNAWKFTGKRPSARIEFGATEHEGKPAYFVRDDGAGFNMAYADKLFGVFQRLHSAAEFPGTGIGLATVRRIVQLHGGNVWAEGAEGQGATFYFTL